MCICTSLGSWGSLLSFFIKGKFVIGKQTQPATTKRRKNHDERKKSTASGNLKKSYRIWLKRIRRLSRNFCSWRKHFGRRTTADIAKPWQIRFSEKWKTKRHLPGRRTVTTKNTSLNRESFWGNRTVFIDSTEKFWGPNVKKDHFSCALLMPKFFSFNAESDGLQRLQD